MKNKIDFEKVLQFEGALSGLRAAYPEFAKEIDKCQFEVGQNHLGSCGHAACDCQMSFEDFHAGRNRLFGTTAKGARSFEFK